MTQNGRSRILVVDDVPESALITKSLLAKGNFHDIDIARGGHEALRKCGVPEAGESDLQVAAGEVDYSLVILDIMMPDIDGLEVCPIMSPHPVETSSFFFRTFRKGKHLTYANLKDSF